MLKAVAVNRLLTMVVMGFLLLFYPEAETSPGKMLFQVCSLIAGSPLAISTEWASPAWAGQLEVKENAL
jgi:hypothetical protein